MKDYGTQRSTVSPEPIEITETKVFVSTNIRQVTVTHEDVEQQEWEFNLVEYDKDEYIGMMSDKNKSLEEQVTASQVALCEVYELVLPSTV